MADLRSADLGGAVIGVACCCSVLGKQRYLSRHLVEFYENPLARFDEEVKIGRAYDQWVGGWVRMNQRGPD